MQLHSPARNHSEKQMGQQPDAQGQEKIVISPIYDHLQAKHLSSILQMAGIHCIFFFLVNCITILSH